MSSLQETIVGENMVRRSDFSEELEKKKSKLHVIIDEQSVAVNEEKKKVRTAMYASDFGACLRKTWFQFHPEKYPPDAKIDARTARIFDNGNSVHERLGRYLKRVPEIDFRDELNVPRDELDVHGRCDGICTIDERGIVVEFKSINKDEVFEAKSEHVGQVMWYMGMMRKLRQDLREDFGFLPDEIIDERDLHEVSVSGRTFETMEPMERWLLLTQGELRAEIVYESKGTQEVHSFIIEYDEAEFQKVRLWFEQLKWWLDKEEVPKVSYHPSSWPCSWGRNGKGGKCQYYSYCHEGKQPNEQPKE